MSNETKTQEFWLSVYQCKPQRPYSSAEYFTVDLSVSVVLPPKYDSDRDYGFTNISEYTYDAKPSQYYHSFKIQIRCWSDGTAPSVDWGFKQDGWYGFFKPEQLEYMAKTHKAVEKALEKLNDEFGYPKTAGEHLHRLAKALKVKKVLWTNAEGRLTASDWRHFKVDGNLIAYADRTLEDLQEECRLVGGKGTKPVDLITNAQEDYDGFETVTVRKLAEQYRGKQLRVVRIQPSAYEWQVNRYRSGLNLVITQAEYNSHSHPACKEFKAYEPETVG